MNVLPTNFRPAESEHLAGIVRLIRRICLLREQSAGAEASRLETGELASAVRDVRLAHGPEALTEHTLQGLFAAEERRVAEVAILAELLIPQLRESFASAVAPLRREPVAAGAQAAPGAKRPLAGAGAPAIPDLLDAMLAAERLGRRQNSQNSRQPAA